MKKFVFVSDFDGTMTDKDFYQIAIDLFVGAPGQALYKDWRSEKMGVFGFLQLIFAQINRDENDILAAVAQIPFDDHAASFIKKVQNAGGDFIILSAGTSYYIDRLLEIKKITGVKVISNPGVFKNRNIVMTADTQSPYYSEVYGVDKFKAVKDIKTRYETLYYAGDSEPDLKAALAADVTFARGELQGLLDEKKHPYIPFHQYLEIEKYLTKLGVM